MAKKSWLERFLTPDADRAERRSPEQFAAYRWNGTAVQHDAVRDISATGVYVYTKDRWPVDSIVALTMQREGPLELLAERRITAHARVVRCDSDGVGFSFVAPKDSNAAQWKTLLDHLVQESMPKDMDSLVRLAEALAFFNRICPNGALEVSQLVREGFSSHKVGNAANIALDAQSLLKSNPNAGDVRLPPALLIRILEQATSTDEDWLRQLWAGLLVASCSIDGTDDSNLRFVDLFGMLTPVPIKLFTIVSAVSSKHVNEYGTVIARPLACKIDDIMTATGARGVQIEREIERLSAVGLIEKKSNNSPILAPTGEVVITASALALELFARCNGYKGHPRDFYTLEQTKSSSVT